MIRENAAPAATPTTTETPAAEVKTEEPAVYLEWLNFGVEAS